MNRNDPNLDVASTMDEYQRYILDAPAIRGSMDWSSFYVGDEAGTCPGAKDPYAICASDAYYGEVVREFAKAMGEKA